MNKYLSSNRNGTAVVILLSFLLFYFPPVINILSKHKGPPGVDGINLMLATVYTVIFCVNYFIVIPKTLFGHGQKCWFYLANLILVAVGLCVIPVWIGLRGDETRHPVPASRWALVMDYLRFSIRDGVMMILSTALAYALQFSRERERLQRHQLELNAERRQIELKGLKMQLNPHFLFNSLNNIYALISISPERAAEAVHDLSGMLRYMIYDTTSSGVPVEKEMAFIEDYVRLMKLRIPDSTPVSCEVSSGCHGNLLIAPLLFLTLVENAFKHFTPWQGASFISIEIRADADKVECRVVNSCDGSEVRDDNADSSGIGIKNIIRQLDLLYPDKASLSLSREAGIFTAHLEIESAALKIGSKASGN